MSAGQVWERPGGLRWVEVQAESVEPSGWRLMVPLVDLDDAVDAPPLVVTVDGYRARIHLLTSVHADDLGEPDGQLSSDALGTVSSATRRLVTPSEP